MFCGGNQNAFFLQAGGVADTGYIAADGFNLKTVKVTAAENNACSGRSGQDSESYSSPTVQPYAVALNRSPDCLFKWQVIPTKQITPGETHSSVVFLQQSVALPNNS